MQARDAVDGAKRLVRVRSREGFARVRTSVFPAIQMTICAVGAYAFAEFVLGHRGPIFAATAGLVSLGFSKEPRTRRVLEVGLGCTLGIAVGDAIMHFLGQGLWQATIILFISIMLARFLDRGTIFTTQLALQSLLIVLLPLPETGPFTRSIDAVVGGSFALILTMIVPKDPRTEPRAELRALLGKFSSILRDCAKAVTTSDSTLAWHALVQARNTQSSIDALGVTLSGSNEIATLAPFYRRHRKEIATYRKQLTAIDLALRNSRVFARRLASVIDHTALSDTGVEGLRRVLDDTADGVDTMRQAIAERRADARADLFQRARDELGDVATRMHPAVLGIKTLEGEALVTLLRPMLVDLLEAAGLEHEQARDYLPDLSRG